LQPLLHYIFLIYFWYIYISYPCHLLGLGA
jgi:hypothetical protein